MNRIDTLVGIDEVGRGPLAGPATVCALAVAKDFDFAFSQGIKDSKKLSPAQRQKWLSVINTLKEQGSVRYSIVSVESDVIDAQGISYAITYALERALSELALDPQTTAVLLDGGLKAPPLFSNQQTIIKGDETEPVISMASIVAKEHRDALMKKCSEEYPEYGFAEHKGYGTKKHLDAIKKHGMSIVHRRTFIHV